MLLLLFVGSLFTSIMYVLVTVAWTWVALLLGDAGSMFEWIHPGQCAVGLSGVIFFIKMVLAYRPEGLENIRTDDRIPFLGMFNSMFSGEARHAVWFELLFIQLFVPHVSLAAHLAGILAGYLYCHFNLQGRMLRASDDLRRLRLQFTPQQD